MSERAEETMDGRRAQTGDASKAPRRGEAVEDEVAERLTVRLGLGVIKRVEWVIARYSPFGNPAIFKPEDFPWAEGLEAGWKRIRAELEGVLEQRDRLPNFQDISRDQEVITRDDHWKTFFFYGYGYKFEENCARCPETTRLIEQVPGMLTAFFSILSPGKHIPPHRGPYKGVVRYHLGLIVPEPRAACRIRVGEQIAHWVEGKSLIFDDSNEHEVWNDTAGTRVVLFLDVVRPLPFPVSTLNRLIITLIRWSPFVQDARKNHEAWVRRHRAGEPRS